MTDPKYDAAVAALRSAIITGDARPEWTLDAMLANPQPFLAVLLRVDAVAAALRRIPYESPSVMAPKFIDTLTETAAEPRLLPWLNEDDVSSENAAEPASEYGRLLAERDRLIAEGADPSELDVPLEPARSKEPTDAE